MPKLQIETREQEKPILLIVGEKNPLIPKLIREYSKDFTVALISETIPATEGIEIYHIAPNTAGLIKNLEEKIEYAVIFLERDKQRHFLESVVQKLVADTTKTAVILASQNQDDFYDIVLSCKKLPYFYFFFTNDVYSEDSNFNRESEAAAFIDNAISEKMITLSGDGLHPLFSIYYKDAVSGISQIIFGPKKQHKFYYLFYSHPQTYVSAAHIIERVLPAVEIKYRKGNPASPYGGQGGQTTHFGRDILEYEREIQTKLIVTPIYLDGYYKGFEKSVEYFISRGPIAKKNGSRIAQVPKKVIRSQRRKIKFFSAALIIAFIFYLGVNMASGVFSLLLFKNSISNLKSGNYQAARTEISQSKIFFDFVDPLAQLIARTITAIGFANIEKDYKIYSTALTLTNIAAEDFEAVEQLPKGLPRDVIDQKIADAFYLYFRGQLLMHETKNDAASAILIPDLSKTLAITQLAPQILGYDRKKTYLLLFQNNGELRPTGGFIGSVGELTLNSGKIEKLNIQDVYEYDGKLQAHIEPHYIIRRYIQPHLYLRDSNFDPDFQESASRSALLYNLETGNKVDGVIAINFEAVKRIIQEIGPIQLVGYDQILDETNTFGFLQKTIDDNFFPGSSQKKDVLQALFNQLILKLENRDSVIKVSRLIPKLMREKHIIFAFNEGAIQSIFSSLGFGGQYQDLRTKTSSDINDFLSVNEANIGINKANADVSRTTTYDANFEGTKITSKITHTINNQSSKGYRAYIRLLVPKASKISGIKIDGKQQTIVSAVTDYSIYERKTFKPPAGLEVDQTEQYDLQIFGFIINCDPGSEQTIEVEYENGAKIPREKIIDYSMFFIKQPGTLSSPLTININYGRDFAPKEVENAKLQEGAIVIEEKEFSTDKEFEVQLIRR